MRLDKKKIYWNPQRVFATALILRKVYWNLLIVKHFL